MSPPVSTPAADDVLDLREFCASRSETAFTALVRRHLPLVYHAALRRLGAPALAEEAAQNAFARLAAKAAAVARHPERLRAWLHRTAFLEACALARKEARLSRLPVPEESPVFTPMNRPELFDRLDEALSTLPELDRELLLRRFCAGEDFRRISAGVGKSETACQKRVERALERLNRYLLAQEAAVAGRSKGLRLRRVPAESLAVAAATALEGMAGPGARAADILPSASRVAAAALRQQAAANAAGSWLGLATAASLPAVCALAALTGGFAGWSQASAPRLAVPSAAARISESSAGSPESGGPGGILAPPPDRRVLPLEDVLESIQAGRLGPLIDFLPSASPADLQAVLAEDNRVYLSEGSPPPGKARQIALRHWTGIDPQGAFAWAQRRDELSSGLILPDSALVLSVWLRSDPAAAEAAFAAVPLPDRSPMASALVDLDDELAGRLMETHPEILKAVTAARSSRRKNAGPGGEGAPNPEREKLVAAVLSGVVDPTVPEAEIVSAFCGTVPRNGSPQLDQVNRIPDVALKAKVLTALLGYYGTSLPASDLEKMETSLPPSLTKSRLAALLGGKTAAANPEAAFRWLESAPAGLERDAYYHQAAAVLADQDPWRLLELSASLPGPLAFASQPLQGLTRNAEGGLVFSYFYGLVSEDTLDRLLVFAGGDDPARALKLLARLAKNQPGDHDLKPVSSMVGKVLGGWAQQDEAAASRWVETSASPEMRDHLRNLLIRNHKS